MISNTSNSNLPNHATDEKSRSVAAFVGLPIGDALGAPIQFKARDSYEHVTTYTAGGVYDLQPGYWTDDTSMALCLAETLIEKGKYEPHHFGKKLIRWVDDGYNSSLPRCFDIGQTTLRAISNYNRTRSLDCGATGKWAGGNGSIMRLSPVPIFYQDDPKQADQVAVLQGQLTHNHYVPDFGCKMLNAVIIEGIKSGDKETALEAVKLPDCPDEFIHIWRGDYKNKARHEIPSDGYVVSTLEAALWAIHHTDSFQEALLLAVNLGDDADTVGAVAGQIAGAIYGLNSIPRSWVTGLFDYKKIYDLGQLLYVKRNQI